MLRQTKDLLTLGSDDDAWAIRNLLVDTGSRLSGRQLLVLARTTPSRGHA